MECPTEGPDDVHIADVVPEEIVAEEHFVKDPDGDKQLTLGR